MGEYEILLKCAHGAKLTAVREQFVAHGGVVLAIDGIQSEKGKATLYIFRDVLAGIRLHAASLLHNDKESLQAEMEVVAAQLQALQVPLLGVVSDDQAALRQAVAAVGGVVTINVGGELCTRIQSVRLKRALTIYCNA